MVQRLEAAGLLTTQPLAGAWAAAWHPTVAHGAHYLSDLVLYASRFTEAPVVWTAAPGRHEQLTDSIVDFVEGDAWLADPAAPDAAALRATALDLVPGRLPVSEGYLTSGVRDR